MRGGAGDRESSRTDISEALRLAERTDIDIGSHCNKPYECDAKAYCWKVQRNIPDYSLFNIFNLGSKKQVALYEQGIVNIDDIPEDFEMTAKQAQAVANDKAQTIHIDKEAIYHLDFDTFFNRLYQSGKASALYSRYPFSLRYI